MIISQQGNSRRFIEKVGVLMMHNAHGIAGILVHHIDLFAAISYDEVENLNL